MTLSSLAGSLRGLHGQRLCLLVDQFEELFRFEKETSRDEAELFIDLLVRSSLQSAVTDDQFTRVHVVVTMRSEFLGECARFNGWAECINQTQFLVPRMDRDGLMRAICRPATLYGGEVSLELAERLIADVAAGQDELPLIQHGLMLMWNAEVAKAQPGSKIVLDAALIEAAGGLSELLSGHADAIVDEAAPDPKRRYAVERLFRALTDLNAEGQAVRRPQAFLNLVAVTEIGHQRLQEIVDILRRDGVSFLLPNWRAPIAESTTIDISHESLIRQWSTLRKWLRDEYDAARIYRHLEATAKLWQEGNSALMTMPFLGVARAWREREHPNASWAARYGDAFGLAIDFLDESEKAERLEVERKLDNEKREAIRISEAKGVIASKNFQLAATSSQSVLDQVATSLNRGDLTFKGAMDMLNVFSTISERVRQDDSPEAAELLARLGCGSSEIYMSLGEFRRAYESAKSSREVAEPLYLTEPNNPKVLELMYQSIWRMGDTIAARSLARSDQEQALQLYLEAEKFARRFSDLAPGDAQTQQVALVLESVGDAHQGLENLDHAVTVYSEALAIMAKIAAAQPKNAARQLKLATAMSRLGQALSGKNDFDAAMEQFQTALEIRSRLSAADRGNNTLQLNLARSHRDIARLYARRGNSGDLEIALAEYRLAIGILDILLTRDSTNASWQNLLAPWYAQYGALLKQKGDLTSAIDQYEKAYELRREVALRDPAVVSRQHALATAGISLADLLMEQQQELKALELYRGAIGIMDDLRPLYDLDVFRSYIKIGDVLKSRGDLKGALTAYESATDIARNAAKANATDPSWQKSLAEAYTLIGQFLIERGDKTRHTL